MGSFPEQWLVIEPNKIIAFFNKLKQTFIFQAVHQVSMSHIFDTISVQQPRIQGLDERPWEQG